MSATRQWRVVLAAGRGGQVVFVFVFVDAEDEAGARAFAAQAFPRWTVDAVTLSPADPCEQYEKRTVERTPEEQAKWDAWGAEARTFLDYNSPREAVQRRWPELPDIEAEVDAYLRRRVLEDQTFDAKRSIRERLYREAGVPFELAARAAIWGAMDIADRRFREARIARGEK